jgi:Rrf2 family nitric oxide-sensitive transcriptional repressor
LNLTRHSDYSLRVLLYLTGHQDRPVSTQEISQAYGISRHHLVRVVQTLQANAFVVASAGRSGGITLARDPSEINIGQVIRKTEPSFRIVECFDRETNTCRIAPVCRLRDVLSEALSAFIHVLDGYTLADFARAEGGQPISTFLTSKGRKPPSPASIPLPG